MKENQFLKNQFNKKLELLMTNNLENFKMFSKDVLLKLEENMNETFKKMDNKIIDQKLKMDHSVYDLNKKK